MYQKRSRRTFWGTMYCRNIPVTASVSENQGTCINSIALWYNRRKPVWRNETIEFPASRRFYVIIVIWFFFPRLHFYWSKFLFSSFKNTTVFQIWKLAKFLSRIKILKCFFRAGESHTVFQALDSLCWALIGLAVNFFNENSTCSASS